jgi:hypothetical protein
LALSAEAVGDTPATALRLTLGRLLGEHAYLTMEAMRATALEGPSRDAARESLDINTNALSSAFASVYGDAAGTEFKTLWGQHIDALLDYSAAVARGDATASTRAEEALTKFRTAFGSFLTSANPHLSGDAEIEALQLHIDQLVAYVDGDYARAAATGREAYAHMFALGDDLARGIADQFPSRYTGAAIAFSPKAELRVALGRLLGEHLVLSAEAMRAVLDEAPDAAGARDAISGNTADLSAAIARIYGADAGKAFSEIWDRHVAAYLVYIEAVRADDAEEQERALELLHGYHVDIADFLASANPEIDRAAVEELIRQHVEALIGQVDAYAAGDHRRSVTIVREAYGHMFTVADALADAIARQFPDRFRDLRQIPPTSTEGEPPPSPIEAWRGPALAILAIGLAALLASSDRWRPVNGRPSSGRR